jgi:hypothetical protein
MKFFLLIFPCFALSVSAQAQCTAYAGPDQNICGNTLTLSGTISNPGSVAQWSTTVSGISFANQSNTVTLVTATTAAQNISIPVVLTETNTDLSCSSSDTVWISFNSIQEAIALVDPADSINCGLSFDRLNAQNPAHGMGYWFDAVANTNFFPSNIQAHPDSATIYSTSYGMHYFYWVTVNGSCRDTSSVVPVHFIEQPQANAGGNYWPGLFGANSHIKTDTSSGLCYNIDAIPSIGSGMWVLLDFSNIASIIQNSAWNTSVCFNNFNTSNHETFIRLEDNHSCVDKDTLFLWVHPAPAGITMKAESPFSFYPNPCTDKVYIKNSEFLNGKTIIYVKTITGQTIYTETFSNKTLSIDFSNYSKGIYIIQINNDSNVHSELINVSST